MVNKKRGLIFGILFLFMFIIMSFVSVSALEYCTGTLNCNNINLVYEDPMAAEYICNHYADSVNYYADVCQFVSGQCINKPSATCSDILSPTGCNPSDIICSWYSDSCSGVCCSGTTNTVCSTSSSEVVCNGNVLTRESDVRYCNGAETTTCTGSTGVESEPLVDCSTLYSGATCVDPASSSAYCCVSSGEEVCGDNSDNDCDGSIDEGCTLVPSCSTGLELLISGSGTQESCLGNVVESCVPRFTCETQYEPSIDACAPPSLSYGCYTNPIYEDGEFVRNVCTGTPSCSLLSNCDYQSANYHWYCQGEYSSCSIYSTSSSCTPTGCYWGTAEDYCLANCGDASAGEYIPGYCSATCTSPSLTENCGTCTSDSECESGHCAPLSPFGNNGRCVPANTCATTDAAPNCYVSSGATKCSDVNEYTCNPYSWFESEPNSVDCGYSSPNLVWKNELRNNIVTDAEISPEGIFPTVTIVLEDYSGSNVQFTIKEKDGSSTYQTIKNAVSQSGSYYYTWTLTQTDLNNGLPESDTPSTYEFYGYVDGVPTSSVLLINDLRAESTYCGDGDVQTPNSDGVNEECDAGNSNTNTPCTASYGSSCTYCDTSCDSHTISGGYFDDGIVQNPPEQCDEGSNNDVVCVAACESSCQYCASPGTWVTVTNNELCETGGSCGDGSIQVPNGDGIDEECDDGNTANGDGCSSTCQIEKDLYWTTASNVKITSTLTVDAEDITNQQYKMWIEYPDSDTTFDLWEYDLTGSDELRTGLSSVVSGNGRYYTWTPSNADFTLTKDDETLNSNYKFYFLIDTETSRDYAYGALEIDVTGTPPTCDDGIQNGDETGFYDGEGCGGSCAACPEEAQFCSDYITQTECENYDPEVAINTVTIGEGEVAICEWVSTNECIGSKIISVNGITVGNCMSYENPREDTCDDDGYLSYSWDEVFEWADSNDYNTKSNCELANGIGTCLQDSESRWHYDPNSDSIDCSGTKSNVIPCPAQVKLPYFDWKNLVITVIVLGLIYLTILEFNKNKKKDSKKKNKSSKNKK